MRQLLEYTFLASVLVAFAYMTLTRARVVAYHQVQARWAFCPTPAVAKWEAPDSANRLG